MIIIISYCTAGASTGFHQPHLQILQWIGNWVILDMRLSIIGLGAFYGDCDEEEAAVMLVFQN